VSDQDRDAAQRDGNQRWDSGLGRTRREDQLEQWIGITEALLQGSQRTITAPDQERNPLH
jgi:hypothetical protein